MKNRRRLLFLTVASMVVLALALCSCANQPATTSADKTLDSEEYMPSGDFDFYDLTEGNVEVRRVTETSKNFDADSTYYIDFENQNMALSVPVSLINAAAEVDSYVTMRCRYPEGGDQELINFYFPTIEEYGLYFPGVSADEISLLVSDVVVTKAKSSQIRSQFGAQGYEVSAPDLIYVVSMYLIHETDTESTAIKLDMTMNPLLMREKGLIDESTLDARLYLDSKGEVYTPIKMVYYDESSPGKGFFDSYLFGTFASTQGSLAPASYSDIEGHYAEDAIKQAQESFDMATLITEGNSFNPDQAASMEDVLEAIGAYGSIPLMGDEAYEVAKPQIIEEYSNKALYKAYFSSNDDYLVNSYASRIPFGLGQIYQDLEQEGTLSAVLVKNPTFSSRINTALTQIGIFSDNYFDYSDNTVLASLPDTKTADQWLMGVTDVAANDPLRAYAACAVHYGLLSPDSDGRLNMYAPITRADLCLSYANFAALSQIVAESDQHYDGYVQDLLWKQDPGLRYNVNGIWDLARATKVDGSEYTTKEIEWDDASFDFYFGAAKETWSNRLYKGTYWFSLKDRVVMVGYNDGEYEPMEVDATLTELTYHYANDADLEYNGETYYFKRQ